MTTSAGTGLRRWTWRLSQLQREEPHFYGPERFFVGQAAGVSDNEGKIVDYGREYEPAGGYGAAAN